MKIFAIIAIFVALLSAAESAPPGPLENQGGHEQAQNGSHYLTAQDVKIVSLDKPSDGKKSEPVTPSSSTQPSAHVEGTTTNIAQNTSTPIPVQPVQPKVDPIPAQSDTTAKPSPTPSLKNETTTSKPNETSTTSTPPTPKPTPATVTPPATNTTTSTPSTPSTPSTTSTTSTSTSTTTHQPPAPPAPTTTSKPSPSTSPAPKPTSPPPPKPAEHHFDGASFIGGAVLVLGLGAIGGVLYMFHKARTDRNYRTL